MDLVESYADDLRFARKPLSRALLAGLIGALVALPAYADAVWLVRASLIWLTAVGVVGQNLLIGYTGLISFGQVGFLAIGAYTFGHLRIAGVPLPLALWASIAAWSAWPWTTVRIAALTVSSGRRAPKPMPRGAACVRFASRHW